MNDNRIIQFPDKPVATTGQPSEVLPSECCGTCCHYRELDVQKHTGLCRANPPQCVVMPQQDIMGRMGLAIQSVFPPINANELCGLFDNGMQEDDLQP